MYFLFMLANVKEIVYNNDNDNNYNLTYSIVENYCYLSLIYLIALFLLPIFLTLIVHLCTFFYFYYTFLRSPLHILFPLFYLIPLFYIFTFIILIFSFNLTLVYSTLTIFIRWPCRDGTELPEFLFSQGQASLLSEYLFICSDWCRNNCGSREFLTGQAYLQNGDHEKARQHFFKATKFIGTYRVCCIVDRRGVPSP